MTWEDVQRGDWNVFTDERRPAAPGDVEIWRIENKSGGWFHPLHIHLVDFRIISAATGGPAGRAWEQGPKDVVYVGEGEIVEVLVHYAMAPRGLSRRPRPRSGGCSPPTRAAAT